MSEQIKDGGRAFPCPMGTPDELTGMTMRDHFAAKAMQGIIANDSATDYDEEYVAANAYKMADAMLSAREQTK